MEPSGWLDVVRALQRPFVITMLTIGVVVLTLRGELDVMILSTAFTTAIGFLFGERSKMKPPGE